MSSDYCSAGKLDKNADILECKRDDCGNWAWEPVRSIWTSVEIQSRTNIFSKIGIGARDALIVTWRQEISLSNALRLNGQFLFLTSITERGRNQIELKAAVCDPVTLTAKPQDRTGRDSMNRPTVIKQASFTFHGILTELYRRNEPDEIYRSTTLQRALVTPKPIILRPGDLVQAAEEEPYTVRQVMDLDPWKNEYVIERQEDV